MSSKYWVILVGLLALLIASCSDDDNPVAPPVNNDTVAPSNITDLTAIEPSATDITLRWTAPGDDGDIAEADHYDIRYATFAITDVNWETASTVTSPPEPTVGGAEQSFTVTGLTPNTDYYFAIMTADEVPNWSDMSNVAGARTHLAGNWTVYTKATSDIPSDTVYSIAIEGFTTRYVGTAAGLGIYDATNWSVIDTSNSDLLGDDLNVVAVDDAGTKWIASRNLGVNRLDGSGLDSLTSTNSDLTSNSVRGIAVDTDDDVWFGTSGGGICELDGAVWTDYRMANSDIHSNIVSAVAFDGTGDLWIGFDLGGVDKFDGANFVHYDANGGLQFSAVTSMAAEGNTMWFGTETGVFKFDGSNWQSFTTANSDLVSNLILATAVDGSGDKWFGTLNGLCRFDGSNWTTYTTQNSSLPDNVVLSIHEDDFDNIWVGTQGGLAVFND